MRHLPFVVLTVGLLTSQGIEGQSKRESIQGVWQTVEVTMTGPGARTITVLEPRPNLIIITAKHYSRVEVHAEGPRSLPADVTTASADELRSAWGPFVGEAGTYEVTNGTQITMRPIAAKNPAAMVPGAFSTYSYKLNGNTIVLTAQNTQNGSVVHPVTVRAVRVE